MTGKNGALRRWGKRAALLVLAAVVGLLVLEIGVRVYSAFFFPKLMAVDATLGWRHSPDRQKAFTNEDGEENLVVQNSWGHRGPERARERAPDTFRVLCLGDSFTEAVHVSEDQVFTRLIEKSEPGLEVLNAGVGAWGTVQQYLYLREEGLAFQPDVVLVMVYENDFTDNCVSYSPGIGARPHAEVTGGEVRIVEDYGDDDYLRFVAPVPFRSFLSRNSYLFYAVNERVWQRVVGERLRRIQDGDRGALDPDDTRRIMLHVLGRMRELTRRVKATLALALIPSRGSVADGKAPVYDPVIAWAKGAGVPCLPLLNAFAGAAERGRRCYFDDDMHWTKEGHTVCAVALLPFVRGLREKNEGR